MIKYIPFKIDSLFVKQELGIKRKNFDKKKDVSKVKTPEFSLPLTNAKFGDNGIMFYGREEDFDSAEMCIDIVQNGVIATGKVYAQPQKTGVLWDSYLIKPICEELSTEILLYLTKSLEKSIQEKFNYDNKATWDRVRQEFIILPTSDGKNPNYKYMEERIRALEEERIRALENYLIASGLNSYELTEDEQNIFNKEISYRDYSIGDLFDIKSPKKRFNANSVKVLEQKSEKAFAYIVRTSQNNGMKGYIVANPHFLSSANTIAFGQDTATVFYQDEPYFTGDKIKVMTLKKDKLNEKIALYIICVMKKAFSSFAWGQSSFNEDVLNETKIKLPVENNKIAYPYMEKYIVAMQKKAVKEVIDYKDQIIIKTKQIVGG